MKSIKSFVYLDEDKMYSISSQLFEGITDSIFMASKKSYSENGEQHGEMSSGRKMGVIITKEKDTTEKRFLHDYAYNLFEEELVKNNLLYTVEDSDTIETLSSKTFVKVKGKVFFDDYEVLDKTMQDFNRTGYALGFVQYYSSADMDAKKELDKVTKNIKDREKKAKAQNAVKHIDDGFGAFLKEKGLLFNQDLLDQLTYVLTFGYKGQFGVRLPLDNILVSTVLNKEYLKENNNALIFKYSRRTEVDFTIIGTITQIGNDKVNLNGNSNMSNMKEAAQNLIDHIASIEDTFTGRLQSECVIDPIAIYREIIIPTNDNPQEET